MKKLSPEKLAEMVKSLRKQRKITQEDLGDLTGINRAMISRIEGKAFIPSVPQLESLAEVLCFDLTDIFVESEPTLYTAFRGQNLTPEQKESEERMMEMIFAARQQILLREAARNGKSR